MEFKLAHMIATHISALYSGGLKAFNQVGQIVILPHPSDIVVIYHPGLDEKIKARIDELVKKNKRPASVVYMTHKNFDGYDGDQLRKIDLKLTNFLNNTIPSASKLFETNISNLLVISIPDIMSKHDESLPLLMSYIENMEGLSLAYVITHESVLCYEGKAEVEKPKITMASGEDRVITQDDVTNLIIDLENAKSIDDIIGPPASGKPK